MRYPDQYKCSQMVLSKFDRDHFQKIDYTYINAFPINITPTAVDYGANNKILEISVTFNYDRFVMGTISSLDTHSEQSKKLLPGQNILELSSSAFLFFLEILSISHMLISSMPTLRATSSIPQTIKVFSLIGRMHLKDTITLERVSNFPTK